MCVTITRFTGFPPSSFSKIVRQCALVSEFGMPVSTTVHPSPSSSSHRLIHFSENGRGIRTHFTPGATSISSAALDEARDKVLMGSARPSMRLSPAEREKTAFHEGGHALISLLVPGASPIHKATIMPRGGALGMVSYTPSEDSMYSLSKRQMVAQIDVALAGRAAEAFIFGEDEITSGASDDLRKASSLARSMIAEWGFSPTIGPRCVGDNNPNNARRSGGGAMPSAALAEEVDREVGALLKAESARVHALLVQHAPA